MKANWWTERRFWMGIACSVVFLFLAFRNVQWVGLGVALQTVDLAILLLAAGLFGLNLAVRGCRWQALLAPLGPVTAREAFAYVNIGYMANALLPLRAGEVIRAVLLGKKRGFSKSAVLATIVMERLLDLLALVTLALLLMPVMPVPPLVKQSALLGGGVGCLTVVGLWYANRYFSTTQTQGLQYSPQFQHVLRLSDTRLTGLMQRALQLGHSFNQGLAVVRSPRQAGLAIGNSVLAWGLVVGSTWLMLQAFHLDLPWPATIMVIVVVNLGSAIPSSPGFIGVVHFLAVVALRPWMVEPNAARGFAIVFHAIPFLMTVMLGAVSLAQEGIEIEHVSQLRGDIA